MTHNIRAVLLLALAIGLVSCQNINTVFDSAGNSYALDGFPFLSGPTDFVPHAFEITNGAVTKTYNLSGNTGTLPSSAFVSGSTLYQFSGAYGIATLSSYALPFASNPVPSTNQLTLASHLMIPAIIDTTDGIALAIVTRNLNLIDLSTMTISATYQAIVGSKKDAGSLVYNHDTNKVFFFIVNYCSWGYCQHIQEYTVSNGVLVKLTESFTPDYNTAFNAGSATGCSLDYSTDSIWCLNAGKAQLEQFSSSSLNTNSLVSLPAADYTEGNVVFDFASNKAYVTADTVTGFILYEVSIPSGTVLRSGSFPGNPVVSVSLDSANVFLGHDNADENPELTIVKLSDFSATLLVL